MSLSRELAMFDHLVGSTHPRWARVTGQVAFFFIMLLRNKDPLTSYFNSGMGLIHSHVLDQFGIQESVICPIANGHQQSLPKSELSAYEPVLKCTKLGF